MAPFFLTSLILLSLFPISSPVLPSELVTAAIDILSDSGFVSMSLTLQLVSKTLSFPSPAATIFAPSDAAFLKSGQPSLDLLQYHFSPLKYSLENLISLPSGSKIPTLSRNQSLIVTTSDSNGQISLNNVKINESAIIDIGSLSIFAIDEFFDPSFQVVHGCKFPFSEDKLDSDFDSIAKASTTMISQGYSIMASFLDLQLPGLRETMNLTVFAPIDEAIEPYSRNLSQFSAVFHRHVLPCKLTYTDLINIDEEVTLKTFSQGFTVKITKSGDVLSVNGVPVNLTSLEMFSSDSLVVHGLQQVIPLPTEQNQIGQSFSFDDNSEDTDYGEF